MQQTVVDEDDNAAGADIHDKWRHADAENVPDDGKSQTETGFPEADKTLLAVEMLEHPNHTEKLGGYGRERSSTDTPFQYKDTDRSQDNITAHGQ